MSSGTSPSDRVRIAVLVRHAGAARVTGDVVTGDGPSAASSRRFRACGRAAVVAAIAVLSAVAVRAASEVAFVDVTVIALDDEHVRSAQTVVVRGDRIVAIGPASTTAVAEDATVIDGAGSFLLPGLVDMHVHWNPDATFGLEDGLLFVAHGVTSVLDLGGGPIGWRDAIGAGLVAPTYYTAGEVVHGGDGATPADVELLVRQRVAAGHDVIKFYSPPAASRDVYERINDVARQLGIPVIGHAPRNLGIDAAFAAGQSLSHAEEFLYAHLAPDPTIHEGARPSFVAAVAALVASSGSATLAGLGSLWRRASRRARPARAPSERRARGLALLLAALAWASVLGYLVLGPVGVAAGHGAALVAYTLLGAAVGAAAATLLPLTLRAWRPGAAGLGTRLHLAAASLGAVALVVALASWIPASWRSSDAGLARLAARTAEAGIWVTPNLVAYDYIGRQVGDEFHALLERPELRYLSARTRRSWADTRYRRGPAPSFRALPLLRRLTGALQKAGVPLLLGTDAAIPFVMPGASAHEELRLLVASGLTPYEALRTGTANAGRYLSHRDDFGIVAVGHRADLVLVRADPLEDVANLQEREGVMLRGRWLPEDELRSLLEDLARSRP